MQEDILFGSLADLGQMIRSREISPLELTTAYIDQASRLDPQLLAVVTLTEELAIRQARAAEAEIMNGRYRGPLHGIPWGVKDLFATDGIPTQWGSPAFRGQTFDHDATVVQKLHDAGAVLIGKLATGELAYGAKWFRGTTRCPWDTSRSSSGSSAGPGAATAAGMVGFSVGTETEGSIISPASVNGIVGLRPTYGRVSRYGVMVAGWTLDKPGPLCRYVDDCATVLRHVMGADPLDPTAVDAPFEFPQQAGIQGKRIGVLRDEFDMPADPELRQILNASLEVLESLGFALEEIELRDLPYGAVSRLVSVEEASFFEPLIESPGIHELLRKDHASRWAAARMIPAIDYMKMQRIRVEMMQYASELFDRYAALVTPAQMGTAWQADASETSGVIHPTRRTDPEDPDSAPRPRISLFSNLVGIPSVSVPCGFTEGGLPMAIQFVGAAFDEGGILQLARAYEQATTWHERHPALA
jgi:Asp-tRNA(Asn)/Glu-tRNA(Gln) amidotransferase A subunit family amidase